MSPHIVLVHSVLTILVSLPIAAIFTRIAYSITDRIAQAPWLDKIPIYAFVSWLIIPDTVLLTAIGEISEPAFRFLEGEGVVVHP
jgi:hypothetical protein